MMSEFSSERAIDWDLQAIVQGRSVTASNTTNMSPCYDAWIESLLGLEDYHQGGHENTAFIFHEHDPLIHGNPTHPPHQIVDSSIMSFNVYTSNTSPKDEPKEMAADASFANATRATISKRRKNKHKIINMVQQAGGDRVMSDKWNWRKYGEKVIKGSPYPRSYYRCSYPAGCLARKQVEQSIGDPGIFLITYMEEHSHPYPTRRHSQAGRTARRFASTAKIVSTKEAQDTLVRTITSESSTKNDRVLAPHGGDEDDGSSAEYVGGNGVCFGNWLYEDDFFTGLDNLEGLNKNFHV